MYDYIIGTVAAIKNNAIVLENNGIGYLIYVSNPYSFEENREYKVYVYQQVKEDENSLFGFKNIAEKELFLKLISVKGLGCKMALPILAVGNVEGIMDAIERENILYLKKFPKIGEKLARRIILDLKGKLVVPDAALFMNNSLAEALEALQALGYGDKELTKVKTAFKDIDASVDEIIKKGLQLLVK